MMNRNTFTLALLFCLLTSANVFSQQIADTEFNPPIQKPAYSKGKGPLVLIDEAHHNFHTATGRYLAFANLLRRDGYVVNGLSSAFSKDSLKSANILVIANALPASNQEKWSLPIPSAFADEEIAAVREWVNAGGALFLIADHMPFPGATEKLAAAFGIRLNNGFALKTGTQGGPDVFKRENKTLAEHPITKGRSANETVDSVTSFTGSAFQIDADRNAQPLMILGEKFQSLMPQTAWQFDAQTPRVSVNGWYQGATLKAGKGRIAVFGEAAMFSAQLAGANRQPMGMNSPAAPQNPQFLLNVMHWLSGLIEQ